MDEILEEQLVRCIECGADVAADGDRIYPLTDDDVLCYLCARRRGGAYDELSDRWTTPPNLEGLAPAPP